MNTNTLEIAAFNLDSVWIAQYANIQRIELCSDYSNGGLTPDLKTITSAKEIFNGKIFVMIRCRPGNFNYSAHEQKSMLDSIKQAKSININGFVYGALTENLTIDEYKCKQIIEAAFPLEVTFHRAFDSIPEKEKQIEKIIELNFKRILTSGRPGSASENINTLKNLNLSFGDKITLIAGGSIRSSNIKSIADSTKIHEFHSAAITDISNPVPNLNEITNMQSIISNL